MVLKQYERPLELEDRPQRPPGHDEVVLEVEAAALCGSDVHTARGGYARAGGRFAGLAPPLVLGHQIAGRVVSTGAGATDLDSGERCVVYCYLYCGSCRRCLGARQNLCESVAARIGFELAGGFADRVTVPRRNVFRAPRGLDPSRACVLPDAVGTSYHAVRRVADVRPGERIAVVGVGALGLYGVRVAALRGGRVIAIDRVADRRLAWAERFGASEAIALDADASRDRATERTIAALGGEADVVVDFVGSDETLLADASITRRGGRVVLVGVSRDARVPLRTFWERRIELRTSLASTPLDLLEVIALAERGLIEPVVHERLPLTELNDGLERLQRGEVVGRLVAIP